MIESTPTKHIRRTSGLHAIVLWLLSAVALCACSAPGTSAQESATRACVNDSQIKALGPTLVYVWSPRMVLSALEAHQAKAAADAKGLQFVSLVDGRLPTSEWKAALARLERLSPLSAEVLAVSAPLCAPQLVSHLAYRHFPTGFLILQGQVHPAPLVGAMPQGFWSEALRLRMGEGGLAAPRALPQAASPDTNESSKPK